MRIFTAILFFVASAAAFPITAPTAGDIVGSNPLDPRPIGSRPVEPRPVEPRPIGSNPLEPRPIGSRSLSERQSTVPNAYIIEFKDGYTIGDFEKYMIYHSVAYEVNYKYDSVIFKGVSVKLQSSKDYSILKNWNGVLNIWPVRVYTLDPPVGVTVPPATAAAVA